MITKRLVAPALTVAVAFACLMLPRAATCQVAGIDSNTAILDELYGRGVHAFHSGQQGYAYEFLNQAINAGSQDARAFYYRGVVAYSMGRRYEAESDWAQAAQLEIRSNSSSSVGRALTRVQGSIRMELERTRAESRLQARLQQVQRNSALFGAQQSGEQRALRQPVQPGNAVPSNVNPANNQPPAATPPNNSATPLNPPMAAANPATQPAPEVSTEDPFAAGGSGTVVSNDSLSGPVKKVLDEDKKMLEAADSGEAAPLSSNPFESSQGGNPFGGDSGAGDSNPFGNDSMGSDDASSNPFADDNPFGS